MKTSKTAKEVQEGQYIYRVVHFQYVSSGHHNFVNKRSPLFQAILVNSVAHISNNGVKTVQLNGVEFEPDAKEAYVPNKHLEESPRTYFINHEDAVAFGCKLMTDALLEFVDQAYGNMF